MHPFAGLLASTCVCISVFAGPSPAWQDEAISFDGDGDYATIPHAAYLEIDDGTFTIEAWIKVGNLPPPASGWVLSKHVHNQAIYGISVHFSGAIEGWARDSMGNPPGPTVTSTGTGVGDGLWHHVALVRDGAVVKLFLDGLPVGSGAALGSSNNSEPLVLGAIHKSDTGTHAEFLNVQIDRVRLWSSARSLQNLRCTMDQTLGAADAPLYPDLVATWNLDGNVNDEIGTSDGTTHGDTSYVSSTDIPVLLSDCNTNGLADECDLLSGTSQDCDLNGVPDECDPDSNGNGVPDACECVVRNYCQAAGNSAGTSASISWQGHLLLSSNNFSLLVADAPPLKFGVFFYGSVQAQVPLGEGQLCIASPVQRLQPPVLTDQQGSTLLPLDFASPPFSDGPFAVSPFSTWNFQFWYRDPLGGPAGFNFSDGLEVTFCP